MNLMEKGVKVLHPQAMAQEAFSVSRTGRATKVVHHIDNT